ncbi:MAG: endolytic transglycosylase MltG [bacterium]|nr:endolytic transglycosylase MltG [bacterium]
MKKIKNIILVFAVIGLGLGLILVGEIFLPAKIGNNEIKLFSVIKGDNVFKIADNLKKEGIIKNQLNFITPVILQAKSHKLQTGLYYLGPGLSPWQIAGKIIKGDVAKEIVTIPEGWNLKEINELLQKKSLVQNEKLLELKTADFSNDFNFLKSVLANANLEGYLFPDTYEIKVGDSPETIATIMLANFDKKLTDDLRQEIKKQNKTISQIVIMASLLEKEAKTAKDKGLVAGILWKRLKIGMRLQVDATVLYALGKESGPVSYDDLTIDSPYNTYKYAGLPIGPIANPGLESIKAAVYPEQSDYWYYLSAPDGTTYFSKTLEEHNQKKAQYLN